MAAALSDSRPIQVVFAFDTTGSMIEALSQIKFRLSMLLPVLLADHPKVTAALVGFKDYADQYKKYSWCENFTLKHLDFTGNQTELLDFLSTLEPNGGEPKGQAYEAMLRLVRKDLSWVPGTHRILVVIGDGYPHNPKDIENVDHIDWKEETQLLHQMGVTIYGIQSKSDRRCKSFLRRMSAMAGGQFCKLTWFRTCLHDTIMAIYYKEKGGQLLSKHEAEVRARQGELGLHREMEWVFKLLRLAQSSPSTTAAGASAAPRAPSAAPRVATATSGASASCKPKQLPAMATKAGKASLSKASSKPVKVPSGITTNNFVTRNSGRTTRSSARKRKSSRTRNLVKEPCVKTAKCAVPAFKQRVVHASPAHSLGTKMHKLSVPRKLHREMVPDTNFRFRQLRWSPWKLAVVPAESSEVTTGDWRSVLAGSAIVRTGAVVTQASLRGKQGSVMCEAAVQTRPGGRRHVVWSRVIPASSAKRLSLSRFLVSSRVRAQLERVVRGGCRVWVRWAKVTRHQDEVEVKQVVKDVYDYAWCHGNGSPRDVWVAKGCPSDRVQIAGHVAMDT